VTKPYRYPALLVHLFAVLKNRWSVLLLRLGKADPARAHLEPGNSTDLTLNRASPAVDPLSRMLRHAIHHPNTNGLASVCNLGGDNCPLSLPIWDPLSGHGRRRKQSPFPERLTSERSSASLHHCANRPPPSWGLDIGVVVIQEGAVDYRPQAHVDSRSADGEIHIRTGASKRADVDKICSAWRRADP